MNTNFTLPLRLARPIAGDAPPLHRREGEKLNDTAFNEEHLVKEAHQPAQRAQSLPLAANFNSQHKKAQRKKLRKQEQKTVLKEKLQAQKAGKRARHERRKMKQKQKEFEEELKLDIAKLMDPRQPPSTISNNNTTGPTEPSGATNNGDMEL